MDIKLSVIIPVYNAGARLAPCLDSVLSQTLQEIEVILVLDAPTDGSAQVARSYARRDSRIRIVEHPENRHIGRSRNDGMALASGEYLAFMDHDDFIVPDWYATVYDLAKSEDCDLALGVDQVVEQGKVRGLEAGFMQQREVPPREAAIRDLLLWGEGQPYTSVLCNVHPNLYRRDFIRSQGILFVDTAQVSAEDYLFQLEALLAAERVVFTDFPGYHHVLFSGSEGAGSTYRAYRKRFPALLRAEDILRRRCGDGRYLEWYRRGAVKVCLNLMCGTFHWSQMLRYSRERKLVKGRAAVAAIPWKTYSLAGRIKRRVAMLILKIL